MTQLKKIKTLVAMLSMLGLCMVFYSCQTPSEMVPKAYLTWYKKAKDALTFTKTVGKVRMELSYLPTEIQAMADVGLENSQAIHKRLEEEKGIEYYQLTFRSTDPEIPVAGLMSEQRDMVQIANHFAFDLESAVSLKTDSDSYPSVLYHYDPGLGDGKTMCVLMAFKPDQSTTIDRVFHLEDEYFGMGPINIDIDDSTIQQLPTIK